MIDTNSFAYIVTNKENGLPLQDVHFSREDAREGKRDAESVYGGKFQVVRYVAEKIIR